MRETLSHFSRGFHRTNKTIQLVIKNFDNCGRPRNTRNLFPDGEQSVSYFNPKDNDNRQDDF